MAKRTKDEALVTRAQILDAAEALFLEQGVANTSLQKIAQAAGVTRGAVYWHFKDKADLLQALLDRATISVDDIMLCIARMEEIPPTQRILTLISEMVKLVTQNEQIRNAINIITFKVELVGELAIMNEHHMRHMERVLNLLSSLMLQECEIRNIPLSKDKAISIARALSAIIDGLFHSWLHAPNSFNLHEISIVTTKAYLYGLLTHPNLLSESLALVEED